MKSFDERMKRHVQRQKVTLQAQSSKLNGLTSGWEREASRFGLLTNTSSGEHQPLLYLRTWL